MSLPLAAISPSWESSDEGKAMPAAKFRVAVSPVLASPVLRRLLPAFAVSAVGDGMSAVGVAWLAIRIAPPADRDLVVGVAVGMPAPSAAWRAGAWPSPADSTQPMMTS